ncbi:MAG: TolC family protein [Candidatus Omnitrophota bacterium]
MPKNIALLVLRVSLGVVFLIFGIGKFQHDYWARTIESMEVFQRLAFSPQLSVKFIGGLEVATGLALILGLWTRLASGLAALQLLAILILLEFQEIRDIALLGQALFLMANKQAVFGIDGLRKRHKSCCILFLFISFFLSSPLHAEEILNWEDCLAEARVNNPDLIYAVEGVKEKEAGKGSAASALFPQISAGVDASTSKISTSTRDSYSYGASATQLVFDGLKTVHDVKAASENIKAARQNYRFTSSEVRFNLRSAFVNLLKAQELIRVEEDIVNLRRDNLELITLGYQSGLEHKGALLTAEANIAEAYSGLSQAKRDVEFGRRQLAKEMGQRQFKPMVASGDFVVRDSAKEKPDFEGIVKNNPSVLQAAAKTNSAAFSLKSAYGNFSPKLTGSAGADKSSSHWPPENEGWNLGLSLDVPIFEGGLKTAQLNQAKALYNQAQANERSIGDTAVVSLERAWAALQDALEAVEVERKSLDAALERSRIAEAQYSIGFISFDNWIIIQDDLVRVKRSYLDARAAALLAEASWIQAKGETLEYAQK